MSSLMFLIFLRLVLSTTYCVKTSTCPTGEEIAVGDIGGKTFQDGDILYFDDAFTLKLEQLKKIAEIHQVGESVSSSVAVTVSVTGSQSIDQHLLIEGTKLTIKGVNAAGAKLMAANVLAFKDLEMKGEFASLATSGDDPGISIKKLTVDDLNMITTEIKEYVEEIHATIKNLVSISYASAKSTITGPTSHTLEVADTATYLTYITSLVDGSSAEFSLSCETAPAAAVTKGNVTITFEKAPDAATGTTLTLKKSGSSIDLTKVNWRLVMKMNAKLDGLTAVDKIWDDDTKITDADGNRLELADSDVKDKYCLGKTKPTACANGTILNSAKELPLCFKKQESATIDVTGYDSSNPLVLALSTISGFSKKCAFTGSSQSLKLTLANNDNVEKPLSINGFVIELVGSGIITVSITDLSLVGSKFKQEVTSKRLLAAPEVNWKFNALEADCGALKSLPSKSLTLKNSLIVYDQKLTKAEFTKDGKSVTLTSASGEAKVSTEMLGDAKLTLSVAGGEKSADKGVEFSLDADGKMIDCTIDISKNVNDLCPVFKGKGWSGKSLNVILPDQSGDGTPGFYAFTGAGSSSPEITIKSGEGPAFIDGKDLHPAATPTPKGGLSGGAIAGIVIACVVVVAAVVVVVVVVIKKKKGKVAN